MIEAYAPYATEPNRWRRIAPLVRDVVATSRPETPYEVQSRMRLLVRLCEWSEERGLRLDARHVLHSQNISRFTAHAMAGAAASTRQRAAARLRLMASSATGDRVERSSKRAALDPFAPYTDRELPGVWSWVDSIKSTSRRSDAFAILALGLGAGLEAREMRHVRAMDIEALGASAVVHVTDHQTAEIKRLVPVVADYAALLLSHVRSLAPEEFVLSTSARGTADLADVMSKPHATGHPVPRRFRTTWIVGRLNVGVPLLELTQAAGLASTATLLRYLPYARPSPNAFDLLQRNATIPPTREKSST